MAKIKYSKLLTSKGQIKLYKDLNLTHEVQLDSIYSKLVIYDTIGAFKVYLNGSQEFLTISNRYDISQFVLEDFAITSLKIVGNPEECGLSEFSLHYYLAK